MSNQLVETKKGLVKLEEQITTKVMSLASERGISFPEGYNPQNAIMQSMLMIKQDPKLMQCDQTSIAESLLQMTTLGLSPASKQCYLIPYGGKAQLSVSYFGQQTALLRIPGVKKITAQVIHEGDDFQYEIDVETGTAIIKKHSTNLENKNKGIVGAYAIILLDEEKYGYNKYIEIMTMEEIKNAWGQGATKGKSPAHTKFPQEMSKKSVINRAIKNFANVETDTETNQMIGAFNEVEASEFERTNTKEEIIQAEVLEQDLELTNVQVASSEELDGIKGEFEDVIID